MAASSQEVILNPPILYRFSYPSHKYMQSLRFKPHNLSISATGSRGILRAIIGDDEVGCRSVLVDAWPASL
jgi:hypothetical protein